MEKLNQQGKLDGLITDCLTGPTVDFPPPFRQPEGKEFLKVHPYKYWQGLNLAVGPQIVIVKKKYGGLVTDHISTLNNTYHIPVAE